MTLANSNGHTVPFVIEPENYDVQDFVLPSSEQMIQFAEEAVETWDSSADLIDYVDYNIEQIRVNEALAKAAKDKATFANKTCTGHKANVEYRRGLIAAVLNAAVSRGLVNKPKIQANTYTVNIQDSVGALEIDPELEAFAENLQMQLELTAATLLAQVLQGAPITLDKKDILQFAKLSEYYVDNYGSATDRDIACLAVSTNVSLDKNYIKQALKNKWLNDLLSKAFKVGKGRVLNVRM